MKIENFFPFVIIVSTYDVIDYLYWVPVQTRKIAPCSTGLVRAHDGGRCKIKVEIVDGPRRWVLDRPDDHIYSEGDIVRFGESDIHVHPPVDGDAGTTRRAESG